MNAQNSNVGLSDGRKSGWFWMDNVVIKEFAPKIGPTSFLVYSVLVMHANRSRECWPSFNKIVEESGLSRRTVIYGINELIKVGLVTKKGSSTKGNIYQIEDVNDLVQNMHQLASASAKNDTSSANDAPALVQTHLKKNKTQLTRPINKGDDKLSNTGSVLQSAEPSQKPVDASESETHNVDGPGYQKARKAIEDLRSRHLKHSSAPVSLSSFVDGLNVDPRVSSGG